MSSTKRSNVRLSHGPDYYITPIKDIEHFIREFNQAPGVNIKWNDIFILDPSAGGDANNDMSYPKALSNLAVDKPIPVRTIDIRDDSKAELKADYMLFNVLQEFGELPKVIITNPPFGQAEAFILKALEDVQDRGWVIMLLRLNFFGSKQRKYFWDKLMPRYVFVHHKRISFTQNGSTDSIEYAHFCWQKGTYPKFTELKVI